MNVGMVVVIYDSFVMVVVDMVAVLFGGRMGGRRGRGGCYVSVVIGVEEGESRLRSLQVWRL